MRNPGLFGRLTRLLRATAEMLPKRHDPDGDSSPSERDRALLSMLRDTGLETYDLNDDGEVVTLTFNTDVDITEEMFERISRFRSLRWLGMYGTRLSEAGLVHLRKIECLERLNLSRTNLSDAGLAQLNDFSTLQALWIRDIPASEEAIYRLQLALPYCKFDWSW